MRKYGLLLLLLCLGSNACADAAKQLMASYRSALQQQDINTLGTLIAADAVIRISLKQGQEKTIFTLTRAEFLQQQDALWRFSERSSVSFSGLNAQGKSLRFQQQENHLLFHQNYRLHKTTNITLSHHQDSAIITSLKLVSEEQ